MPYERKDNRRLRDHPWSAALFAASVGLFIYSIWIAPHDKLRETPSASTSAPAESTH
jgi:hypothetical protein